MENLKYLFIALLSALFITSCGNDDKGGDGAPMLTVEEMTPAMFGDSITINVKCTDNNGVALSTLKASLLYRNEEVAQQTLRTKTEGDYRLKLFVPYYKTVPDGNAQLKLTLQNIRFTTVEKVIDLPVTRPHYQSLTLVTAEGTRYTMTPNTSNPYLFSTTVNSPGKKTVLGYIIAPKQGANGNEITFGEGTQGVTQGSTDNISFVSTHAGSFEVTFNTLTYAYSPIFDPNTGYQEIVLTQAAKTFDGKLEQGYNYKFVGDAALASSNWYYDPDFFTSNGDGTYKFNAVTGTYHIVANFDQNGIRMWATADNNPATLQADGTGAVWIIGSDGVYKPAYSFASGHNWWTGVDYNLCLAQVNNKVYQVTLTIGKQLNPASVNFKFFGQPNWGLEFGGKEGSAYRITGNPVPFLIGDGTNGHDNGNIYLINGATVNNGDTYVLTFDLSADPKNAVLTVTKK